MIFEYRPIFGGMEFDLVLIPDEISSKCKKFKKRSMACRIESRQNQLCIFRMSILIFARVLENSSQRAYFRSCDANTATLLAEKGEIGRFMGFPVALLKDLTCMLKTYLFWNDRK